MNKPFGNRTLFWMFILTPVFCFSQGGTWTWMKGDSSVYNPLHFNYGTMGVPSASNEPPGRYDAAFWTDTAGRFWVYGGVNPYGILTADLWMFNPNTLQWTWMNSRNTSDTNSIIAAARGVFSPQNKPRSLGYCPFTWVTPDNHLWLYGGQYPAPDNDFNREMWQYDPAMDQWAWMGTTGYTLHGTKGTGSSTTAPGGRIHGNVAWVDSTGDLWLYGGLYFDPGLWYWQQMGDVWKYNIASNIWTWMSGDSTANPQGVYGPVGVPSINYSPLARNTQFFWKDGQHNLWLVGGENYISSQFHNDVWKFNSSTLEWTLMQGNSIPDTTNIATGDCMQDINNRQGGRYQNRGVWNICNNAVLNYGGFKTLDGFTNLNDVWAYLPAQNKWVRVAQHANTGSFGLKGVASSTNFPPARSGSAGFTDKRGNMWLFSGNGNFANDLWKFTLDTACLGNIFCYSSCTLPPVQLIADSSAICANDSTPVCAPSGYAGYVWNNGETTPCVEAKLAGSYYVTVTDNNSCSAASNHVTVNVHPLPAVSISVNGDTLSAYNGVMYQWYLNNNPLSGGNNAILIIQQTGSYSVEVTDSNGCSAVSNPIVISGVSTLHNSDTRFYLMPNPAANSVVIIVEQGAIGGSFSITDITGRRMMTGQVLNPVLDLNTETFQNGVYIVSLTPAKGNTLAQKLVISK